METQIKERAPRNRTLTVEASERDQLNDSLLRSPIPKELPEIIDKIICGDSLKILPQLPRNFVDLLFLDPPYNLSKRFGMESFKERSVDEYEQWFRKWFHAMHPLLKPTASIYVCGDWNSSSAIHRVLDENVIVRNRITWEREKGRGAKSNWKNASEDIWFATVSDDYHFDVDAVKLKRRVLAPYRENGTPKDWHETPDGQFRLTHPSNLWTDLTIPFWSMPENTDHPTQKPEKLLAKLILASTTPHGIVFDPFLGSGTTATVARKLGRRFIGIEIDENFACIAAKRVQEAVIDQTIQGYTNGVFWERNSLSQQRPLIEQSPISSKENHLTLFEK